MSNQYGIVPSPDSDEYETQLQRAAAPAPPRPSGAFDLDVQRTAIAKPRNVEQAMSEAMSLIDDAEIASTLWYRLERQDWKTKKITVIEGPSIRMAEVLAYAWRNVAYAGNILSTEGDRVIAEGVAVDLERNNPVRVTASRSIVKRNGQRYSDEMIEKAAATAQSIAIRNAIFKVIPGIYVRRILEHAKMVAARGDIGQRRTQMLLHFKSIGVSVDEILKFLAVESVEDITVDSILRLRGIAAAIRDEETTADAVFREPVQRESKANAERLTTPRAAGQPAAGEPKPTHPSSPPPPLEVTAAAGPFGLTEEQAKAINPALTANIVAQAPDVAATAKALLGAKLFARVWPTISEVATRDDGDLDSATIAAILAAPKTIIEACLQDSDPEAAFRQIAATASKAQQKRML